MKTYKLLISLFFFPGIIMKTAGQSGCTGGASNCELGITNTVVQIISSNPVPSDNNKCEVIFNVESDLSYNSGNKYIFVHSWLLGDYPGYFPCNSGSFSSPTNANGGNLGTAIDQAGKSFLDIGLDNSVPRGAVGVPVNVPILTNYLPDPTVILISPANSPGMTCTKTFISGNMDHISITNIKIIINRPCGSSIFVKSDIWSGNSASATNAQCWIAGNQQSFNDPQISITKSCLVTPFKYQMNLHSENPTAINLTYKIYMDDLDFVYEPGTGDPLIKTGTIAIGGINPSNWDYNTGLQDLPAPFCCTGPWSEYGIYVELTPQEFSNTIRSNIAEPVCATLPIKLKSFTATRNNDNVVLKWETEAEDNNKGFYIQRKMGTTDWQTLGFVNTKAINGSSSSPLLYDYSEQNFVKGITEYRLRQVDIDGRSAISQIRSVRGKEQKSITIVYPNPSSDGRVNIVFDEEDGTRVVSLQDMSGRVIKQWKGITNNTLHLENLKPGFYTVRIINNYTGEQTVEKIIVKDR